MTTFFFVFSFFCLAVWAILILSELLRKTQCHECLYCSNLFLTKERYDYTCPACREKLKMKDAA